MASAIAGMIGADQKEFAQSLQVSRRILDDFNLFDDKKDLELVCRAAQTGCKVKLMIVSKEGEPKSSLTFCYKNNIVVVIAEQRQDRLFAELPSLGSTSEGA